MRHVVTSLSRPTTSLGFQKKHHKRRIRKIATTLMTPVQCISLASLPNDARLRTQQRISSRFKPRGTSVCATGRADEDFLTIAAAGATCQMPTLQITFAILTKATDYSTAKGTAASAASSPSSFPPSRLT